MLLLKILLAFQPHNTRQVFQNQFRVSARCELFLVIFMQRPSSDATSSTIMDTRFFEVRSLATGESPRHTVNQRHERKNSFSFACMIVWTVPLHFFCSELLLNVMRVVLVRRCVFRLDPQQLLFSNFCEGLSSHYVTNHGHFTSRAEQHHSICLSVLKKTNSFYPNVLKNVKSLLPQLVITNFKQIM